MKKFYLFFLFICFVSIHSLFAQEEKHIQVVVKSGGNNEIESCVWPDKYGNITLRINNVDIVAHNYRFALEHTDCDPLKLIVRDANNHSTIYASQTFTPEMANPLPEDVSDILCPDIYYHFSPAFTFKVPAPCRAEGGGTLYLEVVLDYDFTSHCAQLIFPEECYPDDDDPHHHIHYEYIVSQEIEYTCCDHPIDPAEIEPRKVAPNTVENHSVNITPNPFATTFNIEVEAATEENVQLDIFDGNNRLVYTQKESSMIGTNQYLIDGSAFAAGFYYVKIQLGENMEIRRLVKIQ